MVLYPSFMLGQRDVDKIGFAIEMLRTYPEFAAKAGVKLIDMPPAIMKPNDPALP